MTHDPSRQAPETEQRNKIVMDNIGLAAVVAKKWHKKLIRLTFLDSYQEACLGLIDAVEGFDPSRGYKFSTYASKCMSSRIQEAHALDYPVIVPPETLHGAETTESTKAKIKIAQSSVKYIDTNHPDNRDNEAENTAIHREEINRATEALNKIDNVPARILMLIYGIGGNDPMSYGDVQKHIGISNGILRFRRGQGIKQLREILGETA
jgi:RNA polymerase sigma factor (sigma-70 family)